MYFQSLKRELKPILSFNSSVAVMVSGGLDSGLLLYTCALVKSEQGLSTTLTALTVPRADDSVTHSERIVSWINLCFSTDIQIKQCGDPNTHHSLQVWSGVSENIEDFDLILLGDTTNPEHFEKGPNRILVRNPKVRQPLFDYDKKDIVAMIKHLELKDLINLSHTCVASKTLRCGNCWWCRERAWGFAENNYIDTGTM